MRITVLTMGFQEQFLMPYFLRHYSFADRIHVIVDADTSDGTRRHLEDASNVTREEYRFPDMMDDVLKAEKLNAVARTIETDWLMVVDVDELVFSAKGEATRDFLARQTCNVVTARMWQVYRNRGDSDLLIDGEIPVLQRRHGDPNRETGENAKYCKPIVLRMPLEFKLAWGNHSIRGTGLVKGTETLDGAHWAMADSCFAVKRRLVDRKLRQSKVNLRGCLTMQHHHVTEEQVLAECAAHLDDPRLF